MKSDTVIIIEDDNDHRKALANYLRDVVNISVDEVNDSKEALSLSHFLTDKYCAVILDLVLGRPSGIEVLERYRRENPLLPIVTYSGKDEAAGSQALERGATRFFRKPVDPAEISALIRSYLDQDFRMKELAKATREITESDLCIVWKLNKRQQELTINAWDGKIDLDQEYRKTAKLKVNDSPTRIFLNQGEPLFISDVRDQKKAPYFKHSTEAKRFGWVSLVSVPLIQNEQVIGLLDNYWNQPYKFRAPSVKKRVMKMIAAWGKQAATTLREIELSKQFLVLLGLNRELSAGISENQILARILEKGLNLVEADIGWVCLRNPTDESIVVQACIGTNDVKEGYTLRSETSLTCAVARSGSARIESSQDATLTLEEIPSTLIQSEIAVPLRRENQTLGVLAVMSTQPNYFEADKVNLMVALASQATIALEQTGVRRHLRKVSEAALLGLEPVNKAIVEAVCDLTGKSASLWDFDRQKKQLRIIAAKGLHQEFINVASLSLDDSQTGKSIQSRASIIIKDIYDQRLKPPFKYQEFGKQHGWKSALIVPLFGSRKQTLGALIVYDNIKPSFPESEIDLIQGFANQAINAYENAIRLETERNLNKINQVSLGILKIVNETGGKPLHKIARKILNRVSTIIHFNRASIQRIDGDNRSLLAGIGYDLDAIDPKHLRPISQDLVVNSIIHEKKLLILDDANEYPGWEPISEVTAWVGIPLIANERVIGLLTMDHPAKGFFSKINSDLLDVLGREISSAIEKCELLSNLQTINQISKAISSELNRKRIFTIICKYITELLRCTHCTVFEREDNKIIPVESRDQHGRIHISHEFSLGEGYAGLVADSARIFL